MSFLTEPISLFSRKRRSIAYFDGFLAINEATTDKLTITKQPVQQGASINDHAFKEPTELVMKIQFADYLIPLETTYARLLDLQNSRETFTAVTKKRVYENMLIQTLSQTTDKTTENVLAITVSLIEIITVEVATIFFSPRSNQSNAGKTGGTEKAGKKSALKSLFGG